jgi:hypothetical protein
MRTTPKATAEVFLKISPLHLKMEAEVQIGIYRFCCSEQWKPKSTLNKHAHKSWNLKKKHIIQMGTDKIIQRYLNKQFKAQGRNLVSDFGNTSDSNICHKHMCSNDVEFRQWL